MRGLALHERVIHAILAPVDSCREVDACHLQPRPDIPQARAASGKAHDFVNQASKTHILCFDERISATDSP